MKSVFYEFDPVLYPCTILVSKIFNPSELDGQFWVINTDNECVEPLNDVFHLPVRCMARTIEVCSKTSGMRYVMVLLNHPEQIGNGILAHEAYHAANMIAEGLGFFPEKMTQDEPCAYLIQWIANCLGSVLENKPAMMKGTRFKNEDE